MIKRLFGFNVAVKKDHLKEVVNHWAGVLGVEPAYYQSSDFAVPGILGARLVVGDAVINILAGESEDVSIASFVAKRGEGVFLISFEVDSVAETMEATADKGIKFASPKPMPFVGGNFPGGEANFIHPKTMNGVQIELVRYDK